MKRIVSHQGVSYEVVPSNRKDKQLKATPLSGGVSVHFGDPKMPEYPGTTRGDSYCARSSGIKGVNNPSSANFWSRKYLWKCDGKESKKTWKEAGLKIR